jgi:hypothetical protein
VDGDCPGRYTLYRTWTATDRCGNESSATQVITVQDTTPPVVQAGDDSLFCLWPPNHWYVCFTKDRFSPGVTDNCSEPVTWVLSGCASDQPDDARDDDFPGWNGDGSTTRDCVADPAGEGFCVRSERCGAGPAAQDGRHYGVAVIATDACGNSSLPVEIGNIHVPHDQKPHEKECVKTTHEGVHPNDAIPYD